MTAGTSPKKNVMKGAVMLQGTASDVGKTIPVDILGRHLGWRVEAPKINITRVSADVVNGEPIAFVQEAGSSHWLTRPTPLPANVELLQSFNQVDPARHRSVLWVTRAELDARYTLEADGGDLIYVQNRAVRSGPPELMARLVRGEVVDPAQIYFRCSPQFETASPALRWIGERMFTGTGARFPDAVAMRFWELM